MFYQQWDSGYSKQQSTRPQTLGYGLVDSPSGQAGWILEKFYAWMDCDGDPLNVLTRDELLDNIMLYWLPGTGASSARLYWESFGNAFRGDANKQVTIPAGCSLFPKEIVPTPRSWAVERYTNLQYWNELERGGHSPRSSNRSCLCRSSGAVSPGLQGKRPIGAPFRPQRHAPHQPPARSRLRGLSDQVDPDPPGVQGQTSDRTRHRPLARRAKPQLLPVVP